MPSSSRRNSETIPPGGFGLGLAAVLLEVLVADDLRADEAPLEVRVDGSRRPPGAGSPAHRPRPALVLSYGEEGDLAEKVNPYLRPLYDALEDMMPSDRVRKAIEEHVIEVAPLAYMRGRTLSDAFLILDEAQNATTAQMKMFLTRLGLNSRTVITGDKTQIDLPRKDESGLLQVERILGGVEGIALIYLTGSDVIRHRLVKDIIRAYAQDEGADEG